MWWRQHRRCVGNVVEWPIDKLWVDDWRILLHQGSLPCTSASLAGYGKTSVRTADNRPSVHVVLFIRSRPPPQPATPTLLQAILRRTISIQGRSNRRRLDNGKSQTCERYSRSSNNCIASSRTARHDHPRWCCITPARSQQRPSQDLPVNNTHIPAHSWFNGWSLKTSSLLFVVKLCDDLSIA